MRGCLLLHGFVFFWHWAWWAALSIYGLLLYQGAGWRNSIFFALASALDGGGNGSEGLLSSYTPNQGCFNYDVNLTKLIVDKSNTMLYRWLVEWIGGGQRGDVMSMAGWHCGPYGCLVETDG